jgi:GxxExxY protein
MTENELSFLIIGKAIEVHKTLGPGLLEGMYQSALEMELVDAGFKVQSEVHLPAMYKGRKLPGNYRIDLLIEDKIIVETKCVSALTDIHSAQLLTYLKLMNLHLGLLINFNVPALNTGIKRLVNG